MGLQTSLLTRLCSILLALALPTAPAWGEDKTFNWSDDLCEYQGTYDSEKYTAEQLTNTRKLWRGMDFVLMSRVTVFDPSQLSQLNEQALKTEYQVKSSNLKNLKIINDPYFQRLKQQRMNAMVANYRYKLLTLNGYQDPEVLKQYPTKAQCTQYVDEMITGGKTMLESWQKLETAHCEKNSDVQGCLVRLKQKSQSPDAMKYARVFLMTFGWWNCSNPSKLYLSDYGANEKQYRSHFKALKTQNCETP